MAHIEIINGYFLGYPIIVEMKIKSSFKEN
jgi:hypothetical protein